MKIVHLSDSHLGKRQYNSSLREEDYRDAFSEVISKAISISADAVLHTGDIFDTANPSIDSLRFVSQQLRELRENNIPFYSILGNHDGRWMDLLNEQFENAYKLSLSPTYIETEDIVVQLYGIDHQTPTQWSELDKTADKSSKDIDYSILSLHQFMSPLLNEQQSENLHVYDTQKLLNEIGVDIDLLSIGHYHTEIEKVIDETTAYFNGATERSRLNQDQPKYSILTITNEGIDRQSYPIQSARPFVICTLTVEGGESVTTIEEKLDEFDFTPPNNKNAVAVITIEGTPNGISVRDIKQAAKRKGAEVVEVKDNRITTETPNIDLSDLRVSDSGIEDRLNEAIASEDYSELTESIESDLVRRFDISKTHVREKTKEFITDNGDN